MTTERIETRGLSLHLATIGMQYKAFGDRTAICLSDCKPSALLLTLSP